MCKKDDLKYNLAEVLPILSGFVLGISFGFLCRFVGLAERDILYIKVIGDIYLNCINCLVPIFVILILLKTILDISQHKNTKTFIISSFVGFVLLSVFVNTITIVVMKFLDPSEGIDIESIGGQINIDSNSTLIGVAEMIRKIAFYIVPENFVNSLIQNNVMGTLVIVCFIAKNMAAFSKTKGIKSFQSFIDISLSSVKEMLFPILLMTPFGVFSILCVQMVKTKDLMIFFRMSNYYFVYLIANTIFMLFLISIQILLIRWEFFVYAKKLIKPTLKGFAIASSAAVLPEIIDSISENNESENKAIFFLSLANTLQKTSTNIYFMVTVNFVTKVMGKPLSLTGQIILAAINIPMTMACPPVPMASAVYLGIFVQLFDLKMTPIMLSLFIAADPLMDRLQTFFNVCGNFLLYKICLSFSKWWDRRK